jgi:hypothetical protein
VRCVLYKCIRTRFFIWERLGNWDLLECEVPSRQVPVPSRSSQYHVILYLLNGSTLRTGHLSYNCLGTLQWPPSKQHEQKVGMY